MHEQSFSNIISKLFLNCHHAQVEILCRPKLECLGFCSPNRSIFQMASDISSLALCTRLDLPYPMAHGLFRCICGQAIDLTRIHYFVVLMGKAHSHTWCNLKFFRFHCQGCQVPCFTQANTCSFNTISPIIMATNGYYAYNKWYSHFGKRSHCWPNSCESCFMSCFFWGSGSNDCNSSKDGVLLQLTPWRWFHPFSNRDIWMFTLVSERFPSSMCQHGMVNKGL